MDLIKDGWFMEKGQLWPGQAMSLKVEEVLYNAKSKYQDILLFRSEVYGTVLVLDGVIQLTTRDEFAYQEMITHIPMFCHPDPVSVLVIGGGDGGVVREVLKHPTVRKVVLCEIDSQVIEVSKKYLKGLSSAFDDERVSIKIMDGAEFLVQHPSQYDIIIIDSSDPIGPAESLFQKPFYQSVYKALKPGGICCAQGECMWLHADLIRSMTQMTKSIFEEVRYAYTSIPTYPCGQIGFLICSKQRSEAKIEGARLGEAVRVPIKEQQMSFKYYNAEIHKAGFVLPEFARRLLDG